VVSALGQNPTPAKICLPIATVSDNYTGDYNYA
jgi:hypothetical protein